MRKFIFPLMLMISSSVFAQFYVGAYLGTSGYLGDLNYKPFKRLKPSIGVSGLYQVTDRINLRGGIVLGKLEGGDQWSGTTFAQQNRNLSFTSSLTEMSVVGELTLFNLNKINWTPYLFAGVAVFHFNPYVTSSGNKVYLQPLSTEGQGLPEYPERKPYSLTQFSMPFGGGIKYIINDNITLALELGLRRSSTDYLDDVSTSYVDKDVLLRERGATAVQLSYRGGEAVGGNATYPSKDAIRGNPKYKDWYYLTGVHIFFQLNNGYGNKKGYGCPSNPT